MKYTVTWKPEAERHLATIWSQTKDRNAVSKAAHVIDKMLGVNPEEVGESREEGFRVLFERPLGVMFAISPDDRTVLVVTVWTFDSQIKS
jgi:plasmid stabilization system protein ParE